MIVIINHKLKYNNTIHNYHPNNELINVKN